MTFAWIKEHRAEFPVEVMCATLNVSKSGFYAALSRPLSARAQRQNALTIQIAAVHRRSHKTYGSPRVFRELVSSGEQVCENTVAKLMRASRIRSKRMRRFIPRTTDSKHGLPVAGNRLARQFSANRPNQKWVCDITYIPTGEGWLYLAAVIDLYSRKVVGWSMADHMKTELVEEALKMACQRRRPIAGLLHHSDRGVQYASHVYQQLLKANGIESSMSRAGNCYDNAAMESFWSTLKSELVYHADYATHEQARQAIFEYMEIFYNRIRTHSSIGYVSPEAFEAALN